MRIADLTPGTPAPGNDLTSLRNLPSASVISAFENAGASGTSSKLDDVAGSTT
jgi:hypothetical protein